MARMVCAFLIVVTSCKVAESFKSQAVCSRALLSTSESLHIPRPTARLIHVLRRLYSSSLPDDGARNAGRPTRPLDRASNADLYRVRCRRASIWTLDFQPRIPGGAASVSVQESDQLTSAALLSSAHFVHFSLCSLVVASPGGRSTAESELPPHPAMPLIPVSIQGLMLDYPVVSEYRMAWEAST
jgi:hypothetical protein